MGHKMSLFLLVLGACSTGNIPDESNEVLKHQGAPPPMVPVKAIPGEMELVGEPTGDQRSILLISWDTVRSDAVGLDKNPGIQSLQTQSRTFSHAISHFPETGLSHWALMTGVEPEIHGNVPGTGGSRYRGPTMAEIVQKFGYKTGAFIGGMTMTNQSTGLGRGFEVYDDTWDWMRKDVRPGAEVTARAVSWIQKQEGPVFAFGHLFEAHHPYEPQPAFEQPTDSDGSRPPDVQAEFAKYQGEIRFMDSLLNQLVQAAGENSIVILTADHGESFEHDYLYNHRESLWDSTLNVPLIIRGPGMQAGSTSSELVALTDVLPTVLDLAGLPQESKIQGNSLLDPVKRTQVDALTDPWIGDSHSFAVRSATHKVIWTKSGEVLTYDIRVDPNEEHPLDAIPDELVNAKEAYKKRILAAQNLQREALKSRFLAPAEVQRLRALGYVGQPGEQH
jgi:arylsulfatase A-like enzyme